LVRQLEERCAFYFVQFGPRMRWAPDRNRVTWSAGLSSLCLWLGVNSASAWWGSASGTQGRPRRGRPSRSTTARKKTASRTCFAACLQASIVSSIVASP